MLRIIFIKKIYRKYNSYNKYKFNIAIKINNLLKRI